MTDMIIIGGGGHAKVLISVVKKTGLYSIRGYTDQGDQGRILGVPYLGTDDWLASDPQSRGAALALGIGQIKKYEVRIRIFERMKSLGFAFPPLVSPTAVLNEDVFVAEGAVIFDCAVVNSGSLIGRGVILNTRATIEHDCRIGDFVHIAPGVTISGGVTIGPNTLIGIGACVIQGRKIAGGSIIGAGSVVIKDCSDRGTYVGNPAKKIG